MKKKINNQTNITQQYLSKISKNNKHSQYQLKPSYNTMQATTHHKPIYPKFLKIINGTKKKKIIASYFICRKIR